MKVPFQTVFETASRLGFIVIYESLGEIAAYYHKIKDQKLIHVNELLPEWYKSVVLELCLVHAGENTDEFFAIMNNLNNHEQFKMPVAQ